MAEIDHRQIACDTYNSAWVLLEKTDRSPEEDGELERVAWASRWHWSQVGTPENAVTGDWFLSRVYVAMGRPVEALRLAEAAHELLVQHRMSDYMEASVLEGLARALALSGRRDAAEGTRLRAIEALGKIADPEDRELIAAQIDAGPWFGVGSSSFT